MTTDPLAQLAQDVNVRESGDSARAAIDELLWNRTARGMSEELAVESTIAAAWCSAAFEGAEVLIADLRTGAVEDSPMGRVALRTLAMYVELPKVADLLGSSPMQALARLQSVAVADSERVVDDEGASGRPRVDDDVIDPLRLGTAVAAQEIGPRLTGLGRLLTTTSAAPAMVVAGIAHAEIATMQPFSAGSGVVARAMTRAILRERGVDPDGWSIPEAGMKVMGRPSYVKALRGYASGSSVGVTEWLVHHARMTELGARDAIRWVDERSG